MQDPHSHSHAPKLRNVLVERGYLSEREVELLMEAARQHRWGIVTPPRSWLPTSTDYAPSSLLPCAGTTSI
jgi:hypothetical protein